VGCGKARKSLYFKTWWDGAWLCGVGFGVIGHGKGEFLSQGWADRGEAVRGGTCPGEVWLDEARYGSTHKKT